MRMIRAAAVLAAVIGGALVGSAGTAHADDPAQLRVSVQATNPLTPFVVLTNRGSAPCDVAVTALGTVAFSRVEQGGVPVRPIVSYPAFDERLDMSVTGGLRTLAPGVAQQLRVPVLAAGPTGHLIETVSWSRGTGPVAMLYPVRPGQPLRVDVSYDWTAAADDGTPLCGPAAAVAAPPAAGPRVTPVAASGRTGDSGWHGWPVVAGVVLLLGVLLAVLLPVTMALRRRHPGPGGFAVVALLVLAGLAVLAPPPRPAAAEVRADPSIQAAVDGCLATVRAPGHDPAGILPVLDDPNFHVQVQPAQQDSHELGVAGGAFVFWDPADTSRLTGPDGNGTGPARVPCATLYHELFHAREDAQGGRSNFECVTDGGRSGIGTGEVNATRAENAFRQAIGETVRTVYGGVALPAGDCHPAAPTDRYCTENAAGPMCACRTAGCAQSSGDPHLRTFDGRRYDFQAVGEFVASRDPAGGFQVQLRQQPWPGRRDVAVDTAVALDVAGDHVEVDVSGSGLTFMVNGTAGGTPGPLPNGGTITTADSALGGLVGVSWPDGSAVTVAPIGGYGLNLTGSVAAARAGRLVGLFGDADGNPADDGPTGTPYPKYADSWRVDDTRSLFTYQVGQGTADFTDRTFPHQGGATAGGPNSDAATAICQRSGVTDKDVLAGCVLDVALTGQAGFAAAASAAQQTSGASTPGAAIGVPATADIFKCGTGPVSGLQGGDGTDPLRIALPAGTAAVTFPSVTGTVGATAEPKSGPDGDPAWGGTDIPPTNGLSGIHHATQALFTIGVFVPAPPTPPATPDVSAAEQTTDFHPALGELFAIGDGHDATGEVQTFAVPAGASTLCVAFADAYNFKGAPGYFDDNGGAVTLTYSLG
jgi:von Willebrand factor type D domain